MRESAGYPLSAPSQKAKVGMDSACYPYAPLFGKRAVWTKTEIEIG
jgi:hypothetical protein